MAEHYTPSFEFNRSHSMQMLINLGIIEADIGNQPQVTNKMKSLLQGDPLHVRIDDQKKETTAFLSSEDMQFFFTMNAHSGAKYIEKYRNLNPSFLNPSVIKNHFIHKAGKRSEYSDQEAIWGIQAVILDYLKQELRQYLPARTSMEALNKDLDNLDTLDPTVRHQLLWDVGQSGADLIKRTNALGETILQIRDAYVHFTTHMSETHPLYSVYKGHYSDLIAGLQTASDFLNLVAEKFGRLKKDLSSEEAQVLQLLAG